jgi:glycosyltransferase involved in cell wall biosynthesis
MKDPIATIRHLNISNIRKLSRALEEEPKDQIVQNIDRFLLGGIDHQTSFFDQTPLDIFIKRVRERSKLGPIQLFVTHETTRTGAPLIVKQLALECQHRYEIHPIFILCRGGEMFDEFKNDFISYCIRSQKDSSIRDLELQTLFNVLANEVKNKNIVINSVESRSILPYVKQAGFQHITFLVHEMGNFYEKDAWNSINEYADQVIFPARAIMRRAHENSAFTKPTLHVAGQGLLKPELLIGDHESERFNMRKSLGLEPNSVIVLSCGSTIARKGIDIFTFTAISALSQYDGAAPLYFVWLGAATPNYFQAWVNRDIEQSLWGEHIKFLGAHENTIPYFLGSDIFFMTSRGDPFPCVVQEAMAAGMPIVGFDNAGGYPEMLHESNSYLMHYGDISGAAKTINKLAKNRMLRDGKRGDTIEFARENFNFSKYADKVFEIAGIQNSNKIIEVDQSF